MAVVADEVVDVDGAVVDVVFCLCLGVGVEVEEVAVP